MRSSRVTLLLGALLFASAVSAHGNHHAGDIAGQNRKPHHDGHGHNRPGHDHDNLEDDDVTPSVEEPATLSVAVELPTFTVPTLFSGCFANMLAYNFEGHFY